MAKTQSIAFMKSTLFITQVSVIMLMLSMLLVSCNSRQPSDNTTSGDSATSKKTSADSIHIIMANVAENFSAIYRKINAQGDLSELDRKAISQDLDNLQRLFASADAIFEQKSDIYKVGYAFVTRYISYSRELMREPDRTIARAHLFALREICSSCHTQDKKLRSLYQGATKDQFRDLVQYAEFNYSTRNYPEAIKSYQAFLDRGKFSNELQIIQPLQRILLLYLQVYNQPEKALQVLNKYKEMKGHSEYTSQELQGWIAGVLDLQQRKLENLSMPELEQLVTDFFASTDNIDVTRQSDAREDVQRVWLRGRLYEYLGSEVPREHIPKILYWLSMVDQASSYNYYFSYADLYLAQCVREYADLPFAHVCYKAYQNYFEKTYKAPEGTLEQSLPEGIAEEYQELANIMSKHPEPNPSKKL